MDPSLAILQLRAELGRALMETSGLAPLLDALGEALRRILRLDVIWIWTSDAATQNLELQATSGGSPAEPGRRRLLPLNRSRLGQLAMKNTPQLFAEALDPGLGAELGLPAPGERGGSLLAWPMSSADEQLGILLAYGRGPGHDAAFELLGGMMPILIQALVRRRDEEKLEADAKALATVNRIVNALSTVHELTKLVQIVTDEGTELCGAEFGAFFYNVIGKRGESYMLYTLSGVPIEKFSRFPMPRNTAIFAPTFAGQGVVRLDDVTQDPRYGRNDPYFGMPRGHLPVCSYLAVPVSSRSGEVLGGLFFGHAQPGMFTERHEQLMLAVAHQAAIGIERARLYGELETQYKAAAEAREHYRALIELSPQFVWTSAADGTLTYSNQRWYDYTGLSEAETRGPELATVIHPDDIARLSEVWDAAAAHGLPYETELRFRQKADGSYRWHLSRAMPIRNAEGNLSHWVGVSIDIHERKEAEAALTYQSHLTRTITDNAASCLFMMDKRGHPTFMNPAARELIGYQSLEEIKDRSLHEAIHRTKPDGSPYPLEECPIDNAQNALEPIRNKEEVFCTKDGRLFPVSYSLTPLQRDGELIGSVMEFRDITAQKQLERALRENEERLAARVQERTAQLEASNKELEAFSYSVSHDLRAPLRGIDGFSDVLLRRYSDSLDETARSYLIRVKEAAGRMGSLIEDMLKLSRLTRREMRRERVDLSAMAASVIALLQEREPDRIVAITIAPGLETFADPVLMRAVLENLLGNAWKFTGKLEGSAEIKFFSQPMAGELVFVVRDNGAGFDMEYQDKLFTAFQRLHSENEFEGTGVGLASVQRVIRRHGGRVWAEGLVDGGASFYFTTGAPMPERSLA